MLIDVRLGARSYDYQKGRWRDALVLALALFGAALIFQAVFLPYMPAQFRFGPLTMVYLGLTFALGLVLGFFVPSVAALYLRADKLIAEHIPSEADFLARVKDRRAATMPPTAQQDGAATSA